MLGKAWKLITPIIIKTSHINKRKAYKNKQASNCSKLPHTCSLVQNHPRKAASTPRTTTDLALLNYKGKHAYIKNKYFCHSKIVINSPEVQLGIARPHAEVGHKNIIIFSYKNHWDRFCINGKQFI
jgi:hypothetical protein